MVPVKASRVADVALDLASLPLIDQPDCEGLAAAGAFGSFGSLALQLHRQGYGLLQIDDPLWLPLLAQVRAQLEPLIDLQALASGELGPQRFQDAWLHHDLACVREVACHPEILAALQALYGRQAFPFQTLNFPNGTTQHFHSDAVHFHSLPHGFMCGIWVALEDISADAGPLVYYPGSHREPYLRARDLGLRQAQILAEAHPQVLFEPVWRDALRERGYRQEQFLARQGDVLIWHANLLHGGASVKNKTLSRWSQVSHYYFRGCAYTTPLLDTADADPQGRQWRQPLDLTQG